MYLLHVLQHLVSTSVQSSLALSLLRGIYTTGEVMYDGISTSLMNLDSLRSNVTIIPQVVSSSCYDSRM